MKIACWVFAIGLLLLIAEMGNAAIPQQIFGECATSSGVASLSKEDLQQIAKVSNLFLCPSQVSLMSKEDIVDLMNDKIDVGITVAGSNFSKQQLSDMAKTGRLTLIVDGSRFSKNDLGDIGKAGAQLVIVSGTSGFSKFDLISIAQAKPFILAVTSNFIKEDLKEMMDDKIQLMIYVSQAGLGNYDILDITKSHPDQATIRP